MSLEEFAFDLITVFEGLKLTSYKDSAGVWTIGFGHTGADVTPGLMISYDQALQLFKEDTVALFSLVKNYSVMKGGALASFGYNLGIGTLHKVLNDGDLSKILLYDKAGTGHYRLAGLTARRKLEYSLIQLAG